MSLYASLSIIIWGLRKALSAAWLVKNGSKWKIRKVCLSFMGNALLWNLRCAPQTPCVSLDRESCYSEAQIFLIIWNNGNQEWQAASWELSIRWHLCPPPGGLLVSLRFPLLWYWFLLAWKWGKSGGMLFWKGSPILQGCWVCSAHPASALRAHAALVGTWQQMPRRRTGGVQVWGFLFPFCHLPGIVSSLSLTDTWSLWVSQTKKSNYGLWLKSLGSMVCANQDNHLSATLPCLPAGS